MTCRRALTFLTSFGILLSLWAGALRGAGQDANTPVGPPAAGTQDANAPAAKAAAPTIRPAGAPDGETRVASPCKNEANASPAIGQSLSASARFLCRRKEGFLSDSSPAGHLGAFSASPRTKASKGGIHGTNRLMGC